jgi:hypothetical protein
MLRCKLNLVIPLPNANSAQRYQESFERPSSLDMVSLSLASRTGREQTDRSTINNRLQSRTRPTFSYHT